MAFHRPDRHCRRALPTVRNVWSRPEGVLPTGLPDTTCLHARCSCACCTYASPAPSKASWKFPPSHRKTVSRQAVRQCNSARFAKAPASRAQLTKGPAHVLPAPTHGNLQQKSDPCIFNSLHTLASLFCKERQLISFSFNRLRTLYQNNGGVPPRGNVVLALPHFFKPFVFTLMQIAPPTTPFF